MVLKELIFYHLLCWQFVVVLKELIFNISNLGVCGGLERTDFLSFATLGVCGGHERTDF